MQWHQFRLNGNHVQSGTIAHPTNSYIQTTLAVNKDEDVLIGFQETGPDLFISPRCAWRLGKDRPGTTRGVVSLGEGKGATDGVSWGDYSGTVVDGDNLTFEIRSKPDWAKFSASTGKLEGTPPEGSAGTFTGVQIVVSDGKNSASLDPFSIAVVEPAVGSAELVWDAPSMNVDGSPLTDT